jgi:hypothetical protein
VELIEGKCDNIKQQNPLADKDREDNWCFTVERNVYGAGIMHNCLLKKGGKCVSMI